MKKKLFLNRVALLLALSLITGCANSEPSQSDNTLIDNITKDLNRNRVVIVYKMRNKDRASEQYADWSAYLNDFVSSSPDHYKVYQSDEDFDRKYLGKYIKTARNYTLFMKKGKPDYFYNGVVLEPMVYTAVNNAYFKDTISPVDKVFLPDVLEINFR